MDTGNKDKENNGHCHSGPAAFILMCYLIFVAFLACYVSPWCLLILLLGFKFSWE